MGHENVNRQSGDLLIRVNISPHKYFRREGRDIHTERRISISQAVLGDMLDIATLYGKKRISVSPGTESGTVFKITGYGLEHPSSLNNSKGNHYVHFVVDIPTKLNEQQLASMRMYSFYEETIPVISDKDFC